MASRNIGRIRRLTSRAIVWAACLAVAAPVPAARITLNDGRVLRGRIAPLGSLAQQRTNVAPKEGVDVQLILLLDDDLRRVFVSKRQVQEVNERDLLDEPPEVFRPKQPVSRGGSRVAAVGAIESITPFDEFGRRLLKMRTAEGQISIVQGITELTPTWAKLEPMRVEGINYLWDMRIATTSIPGDALDKILTQQIDKDRIDQRLRVVRFYLQMERYKEAESKLSEIIRDFPDRKAQYEPLVSRLHQAYARRILTEVDVRRKAGQHRLAAAMLENFPTEGVAGETLEAVRQKLSEQQTLAQRGKDVLQHLKDDLPQVADASIRAGLEPVIAEIAAELNIHTLERMAAYEQTWGDAALAAEERLAAAAGGWLIGTRVPVRKPSLAISLYRTRQLVEKYLAEPAKLNREEILSQLKGQEAAAPELVAQLVALMKPPLDPGKPLDGEPGLHQFEIEVAPGAPRATYYVQTPPEYDPRRAYPCIVTLHGSGTEPLNQLEWWVGARNKDGDRLGQAGRNGYIVIAPAWAPPHQREYGYSSDEHRAVLNSMRDATRRFSVDSDRVFLSGHSMGGDAAWDMALAHPDLWAGVIPIAAAADRFVSHYWENGEHVPFYLVGGELDAAKAIQNARDLDRYMNHGYDSVVVEFQGRGHEHFSDEVLELFDWMQRRKRNFFPKEFTCRSLRPWDNFFWWVELANLPPKVIVDPASWPPPRGTIALQTAAEINATGGLNVRTGAGTATVWISPEIVDFSQPIKLSMNGKTFRTNNRYVDPDLGVLLEDVRLRADRQHPFWAKIDMPVGDVNKPLP